ncbi:RNA repair domain-containing protein [Sorangium sp. So ce119]|uniref:RNA repair domain-containing protein n=1 Tax=Sorangium sp. So ce119 TaxID=3133279 RepID=UPI003F5F65D8
MARQPTSGHEGEAPQKLRTSRQVYDQIRWDPRLDPAAFVIGYETRESGAEEIGLPRFDPEGDIPWHRIRYIRQGTTTVWDRRSRVDLLEGKRSAPAPSAQCGLDARPVHRSALALIPPREAWAPIEAIRQAHDRHVERWMPHINLLYGFLPEAAFAEARGAIAAALRDVAPFEVTLDDVRRFQHRAGATVWLHPRSEPPGALEALQARLEALFPRCSEQSTVSAGGFTPHLSIAQLRGEDGEDGEALVAEWRRMLPITFQARAIHLLSRRGDEAFAIRHAVPLGEPSPEGGDR